MLSLFKKKIPLQEQQTQHLVSKSGSSLLTKKKRKDYLSKTKRLLSVTDHVWEDHYLYAIKRFCEFVQDSPGSEFHHHSYNGGLIDHTLEVLYLGIKASHGFVIPPHTKPEDIQNNADKWRFGVFITLLAHDIGKIITDIEFVYKLNGRFVKWNPWYGNIPNGVEYTFRYKRRAANTVASKSIHEKASISLLPMLLTKDASSWLFSDEELLAQIFSTLTKTALGGEVISKITQHADMGSVSNNMSGKGGTQSQSTANLETSKKGFHEKIITSLRKLANDGSLKRNRPGAALWITENYTWAVSKAVMEAVKQQLIDEGHTSIPRNVMRFFSTLNEHGLIVKKTNGDSIWKARVEDMARDWRQKLTFLKFNNEIVWPAGVPDFFDGEIISLEKDEDVETNTNDKPDKEGVRKEVVEKTATVHTNTESFKSPINKVKTSNPMELDFFQWLLKGIENHKIRVNEKNAAVHFTDQYLILVSPRVFLDYFKSFPIKKTLYQDRANTKKPYTALQREIEALNIHRLSKSGKNINTVTVEGSRNKSTLNGYLVCRSKFPQLEKYSANSAIKID